MTLTAESFTGRVLAVFSRRSPAFRPSGSGPHVIVSGSKTPRDQVRAYGPNSESTGSEHAQQLSSSIDEQKATFYRWHAERAGATSWALHLAQHPEDAEVALQSLAQEHLEALQARMDEVLAILRTPQDEDREIQRAKSLALAVVNQVLAERLGPLPYGSITLPQPRSRETRENVEALPTEEPSYPGA
ncbi:hypothetical protein [Streptomyces sp. NPDC056670]|uniref:hypothetical protein n=1 Tax=Streptomyces sp. NPDC056670 TaxID=3345904 RepID=UPI0036AE1346